MGPQLYRCGNMATAADMTTGKFMLQWGRNFIVAEMIKTLGETSITISASMGPQLYRCGNGMDETKTTINGKFASMGPQLYRCGNRNQHKNTEHTNNASMGPQLYRCGNEGYCPACVAEILQSFNGAATLSLRKSVPSISKFGLAL